MLGGGGDWTDCTAPALGRVPRGRPDPSSAEKPSQLGQGLSPPSARELGASHFPGVLETRHVAYPVSAPRWDKQYVCDDISNGNKREPKSSSRDTDR